MYAIVKTGGKQYRVEEGQSLLVERLRVDDGGKAALTPLLVVDGSNVVDGDALAKVSVEARVVGHERGPKLRVVKFKPKRGYKRRTGHRQELTRIEVTSIKLGARRGSGAETGSGSGAAPGAGSGAARRAPKPVAAEGAEATAAESTAAESKPKAEAAGGKSKAETGEKPKAARPRSRRSPAKPKAEEDNGA